MEPGRSFVDPSLSPEELARRYEELQLRVTRFSAVEQKLIAAQQRLDRQVGIHERMQKFNTAALREMDDAAFRQLVAEAIVDAFETEVGILAMCTDGGEPHLWGLQGIELAEALLLVAQIKQRVLLPGTGAALLVQPDNSCPLDLAEPFREIMACLRRAPDATGNAFLLIAGTRRSGAASYEPLRPEHTEAYAVFAQQVEALLANRRAEQLVLTSLRDKEALLKEVHHRVKNNLQVISSMLRLEQRRTHAPEAHSVIREMNGRIRSMSLLHETLYRGGNFAAIDLGIYLERVATQSFRSASDAATSPVRLDLRLQRVAVEISEATSCGLIVNELVSNAFKHGFRAGRAGQITVSLASTLTGAIELTVSDDGAGLPADFTTQRPGSLGLLLVSDLVRQLGGTLEVGPAPLARFHLTFRSPADPSRRVPSEPASPPPS
jgi:two-component sensor histidine kinase